MNVATAARAAAGACLVVAAAWVADAEYFSHGLSAHWYHRIGSERVLVDHTTEHRPEFPNVHRALSRYLQAWPATEHGVPKSLPQIDCVLRGRITIPGGGPLYLAARARDEAVIFVDGERLEGARLSPGSHELYIRWRGTPQPHRAGQNGAGSAYLSLTWGSAPNPTAPVPRWALTPADGWGDARIRLWLLAVPGLVALVGLAIVWIERSRSDLVRRARVGLALTALVALLGVGVRGLDYEVMPEFRENADELFAMWNGWSLLEDGTTRGWSAWARSYHSIASVSTVQAFGQQYTVISPYFEHPPMMHLLVGAAAHAGGAQHWLHAKLEHTRLVPIGLMAVATFLLVSVGRRLFPCSWSPWVGALLFNTLPIITLQTRVIKEEDLLLVLLLGGVLFYLRWRDDGHKTVDWVGAAICVGLAPLTKVPGVAFIVALAMLFAASRGWRDGTRFLLLAAGIGSLLLVYAALIDWTNFLFAQRLQSGREINWSLLLNFFDLPRVNHNEIGRGWSLFLWLSFVSTAYARGPRASAPLTVPPTVYLVMIGVATGSWQFGWYIVPVYPFLCLGAGDFIVRTWRRPTFLAGVLLVAVLAFYSLNFLADPQVARTNQLRVIVTAVTFGGLAPFALAEVWPDRAVGRGLGRLGVLMALSVAVFASVYVVALYDRIFETHRELDTLGWFV